MDASSTIPIRGLVLVLFTVFVQGQDLFDCRDGWISSEDSCYKMLTSKNSWDHGQELCQAQHASLLVVQSDAERQWLVSEREKLPDAQMWWLGQKGLDEPQHWVKSLEPISYVWPLADEPDNLNGKENCVMISRRGFLRDDDCSTAVSFICHAKKPTETHDCATNAYPGVGFSVSDHCYYFNVIQPRKWSEARDFCRGISLSGGDHNLDLLSFENMAQFEVAQNLVQSEFKEDVWWTGLNYRLENETFGFSDGTLYSEKNVRWLTKDDLVGSGDDCWVMLASGKATLYPCDTFLHSMCKHSRLRNTSSECPPYWEHYSDSCYFFSDEVETWKRATDKCQSLEGNLLVATSKGEGAWLETASALRAGGREYWTGLNDTDGRYVWQDGSPANMSLIKWSQTLFHNTRCLVLDPTEQIGNLVPCEDSISTEACEYTLQDSEACIPGWTKFQSKCYFISAGSHDHTHNWYETMGFCNQMELEERKGTNTILANYITIENNEQLAFVSKAVTRLDLKSGNFIWLGLNSVNGVDDWSWFNAPGVSFTTVTFRSFKQPDPFFKCAVIKHDGEYRTRDCDQNFHYLCERHLHPKGPGAATSTVPNMLTCLFVNVVGVCLMFVLSRRN